MDLSIKTLSSPSMKWKSKSENVVVKSLDSGKLLDLTMHLFHYKMDIQQNLLHKVAVRIE